MIIGFISNHVFPRLFHAVPTWNAVPVARLYITKTRQLLDLSSSFSRAM